MTKNRSGTIRGAPVVGSFAIVGHDAPRYIPMAFTPAAFIAADARGFGLIAG